MEPIESEHAVTIKYVLRTHLPDGTVTKRPEARLEFILGVERQVPTLEKVLFTARVGDRFSIHIPASELYGEHDPSLIRELPKSGLIKQRIKKGQYYRQIKKGCLVSFKVLEIGADDLKVDFNEPMAGITASMDVEVLSARKASAEEISAAAEAQLKRNIGCGP